MRSTRFSSTRWRIFDASSEETPGKVAISEPQACRHWTDSLRRIGAYIVHLLLLALPAATGSSDFHASPLEQGSNGPNPSYKPKEAVTHTISVESLFSRWLDWLTIGLRPTGLLFVPEEG